MRSTSKRPVVLSFFASMFLFTNIFSAAGDLDPTFNSTGFNIKMFGDFDDRAYACAVQSDGKIVVAGQSGFNFGIVRYLSTNGDVDVTFNGGKVAMPIGVGFDKANAVAIQPDGKIVVAGRTGGLPRTDFAIARFTSSGLLDTTFGTGGVVIFGVGSTDPDGASDEIKSIAIRSDGRIIATGSTGDSSWSRFALIRYSPFGIVEHTAFTSFPGSDHAANSVRLQADGKIVVAGRSNGNFALARYTSAGVLDTTFDLDGKLTTDFGATDEATALAIQGDGKIVAAGSTSIGGTNFDFVLARYNSSGSLDTTFSGDGKQTVAVGTGDDVAHSMAIQSDGKILVGGSTSNGTDNDFALIRLTTSGALDATYDLDGKVITGFSSGSGDKITAIAIQPADGKVVACGYVTKGTDFDFAILRFNTSGLRDTLFNGQKLTTGKIAGWSHFNAQRIQADGKIIAAGWADNGNNHDFAIARYTASGALDATFGLGGIVTTAFGTEDSEIKAVTVQPDGKIVAVGSVANSPFSESSSFALARYNADGNLDTSFDGDGKLIVTFSITDNSSASSVLVQADGKIVVGGYSNNGTNFVFALARFNSNGTLDPAFGTAGKVMTAFGVDDYATSIAIQADGKIVAGGYSRTDPTADYNFAIARYTTAGLLDTSFDGDGKATVAVGTTHDLAYCLAIQSDGKILMFGSSSDGSQSDLTGARFTTSGTLDSTFGSGGRVITPLSTANDGARGVAIQPDGKLVVAGYAYFGQSNIALVRYNANGSLDNTFSGDGKQFASLTIKSDFAAAVAIQSDSKIVVSGSANETIAIARFKGDLTSFADESFSATISGRITTVNGKPIRNASVQLSGGTLTETLYTKSNEYGYYQFDGIDVFETYFVTTTGKRFVFLEPTRKIELGGNLTDFDFVAN